MVVKLRYCFAVSCALVCHMHMGSPVPALHASPALPPSTCTPTPARVLRSSPRPAAFALQLRAGREETLVWAAPSLPPAPGAAATGGAAAGGAAAESPAAAADRVWAALLGSCHRLLDPRADEYTTALAGGRVRK